MKYVTFHVTQYPTFLFIVCSFKEHAIRRSSLSGPCTIFILLYFKSCLTFTGAIASPTFFGRRLTSEDVTWHNRKLSSCDLFVHNLKLRIIQASFVEEKSNRSLVNQNQTMDSRFDQWIPLVSLSSFFLSPGHWWAHHYSDYFLDWSNFVLSCCFLHTPWDYSTCFMPYKRPHDARTRTITISIFTPVPKATALSNSAISQNRPAAPSYGQLAVISLNRPLESRNSNRLACDYAAA